MFYIYVYYIYSIYILHISIILHTHFSNSFGLVLHQYLAFWTREPPHSLSGMCRPLLQHGTDHMRIPVRTLVDWLVDLTDIIYQTDRKLHFHAPIGVFVHFLSILDHSTASFSAQRWNEFKNLYKSLEELFVGLKLPTLFLSQTSSLLSLSLSSTFFLSLSFFLSFHLSFTLTRRRKKKAFLDQ